MEMKMSDREWQDSDNQDGHELGFELREMLSMLKPDGKRQRARRRRHRRLWR